MSEAADFRNVGSSSLGKELSLKECEVIAGVMQVTHLGDGEQLVGQSGSENTLFLLVDGYLDVLSDMEGKLVTVYTMSKGEVAGTRAFVDRSPRKATLRAKGKATVYSMEPDEFEALLERHPQIVYKVMRGLFRITHSNLLRMNKETEQLANYISKSGGRY